jgi:hypothetical protein
MNTTLSSAVEESPPFAIQDFPRLTELRQQLGRQRHGLDEPGPWRQQVLAAVQDIEDAQSLSAWFPVAALLLIGSLVQPETGHRDALHLEFRFQHPGGPILVTVDLTPVRKRFVHRPLPFPAIASIPLATAGLTSAPPFVKGTAGNALKARLGMFLDVVGDEQMSCVLAGAAMVTLARLVLLLPERRAECIVSGGVGDDAGPWYDVRLQAIQESSVLSTR